MSSNDLGGSRLRHLVRCSDVPGHLLAYAAQAVAGGQGQMRLPEFHYYKSQHGEKTEIAWQEYSDARDKAGILPTALVNFTMADVSYSYIHQVPPISDEEAEEIKRAWLEQWEEHKHDPAKLLLDDGEPAPDGWDESMIQRRPLINRMPHGLPPWESLPPGKPMSVPINHIEIKTTYRAKPDAENPYQIVEPFKWAMYTPVDDIVVIDTDMGHSFEMLISRMNQPKQVAGLCLSRSLKFRYRVHNFRYRMADRVSERVFRIIAGQYREEEDL